MDQLTSEMSFDLNGVVKYIPIVIFGAFAFILTGKAICRVIEFPIIDLVDYPLIFSLYLITTAIVFKYGGLQNRKTFLLDLVTPKFQY